MTPSQRIEPIVLLLFVAILFFTSALFLAAKIFPDDGQIFQVVSGLLTGFSGALFMRIKPRGNETPVSDPPPLVPPVERQ